MSAALVAAIVFTVALLVVTAYFIMGSVPLLILRHDTPISLGAQMQLSEANAISAFRRMHLTAILINVGQLALIVATLIAFSMQSSGLLGSRP
jgi:hypothetical protein